MLKEEIISWETVLEDAREVLKPKCHVCPNCDGRACAGLTPGPGGKGTGKTFMRNSDYLHDRIRLQMDVLGEPFSPDTSVSLFGKKLSLPVLAAPIGMVAFNLSDKLNEYTYAKTVLEGMTMAGSLAITGGGAYDESFFGPIQALEEMKGEGIPNLKPWERELLYERIGIAEKTGAPAFVIDIDTAGLPHAGLSKNAIERKDEKALAEIVQQSEMKFIVKGIMTPKAAVKAAQAGVYGIVVSNHGGRVMDEGLSTAEVLPEIREVVGSRVKIFVDGGVRSGADVFKMLALGADAVLIGRPYSVAAYGGGVQGVFLYTQKIQNELIDVMRMTGCEKIADITADKIKTV